MTMTIIPNTLWYDAERDFPFLRLDDAYIEARGAEYADSLVQLDYAYTYHDDNNFVQVCYRGSDGMNYLVAWEYDGDRNDWVPLVLAAEEAMDEEDEED